MSASPPCRSTPSAGRPIARAGTEVAAATASTREAPSACRFLTASIIVRTLPASTPSGRRATPSRISTSIPLRRQWRSLVPAAAIASVTSARRPAAARRTSCAISGRGGGRRGSPGRSRRRGRAPHPRCRGRGGERAHRVEEVRDGADSTVEGRVGFGRRRVAVAARDDDTALEQQVDELQRAGQLRRERDLRDRPRGQQSLEQVRSGSRRAAGGCAPSRSGERNGPSRWTPRIRGPACSSRGSSFRAASSDSSGAVIRVG